MHYFFLEKQSPLTQRWQVRQVAFDSKYRYLYYTKALSRVDLEEVMLRGSHDGENSFSGSPHSPSRSTSSRKVKWSGKVKVTQLRYAADEYMVPPGNPDFDERTLLTLIVVGHERSLERRRHQRSGTRSVGGTSERSTSLWSTASRHHSVSHLSSVRLGESDADEAGAGADDEAAEAAAASANQPLLQNAEPDVPEPESPSGFLHMPSYPVNESLDEDFEDEDENLFRDIDLVPDDADEEDEEAETSVAVSEAETEDGSEDGHGNEDSENVAFNSPPSTPTESIRSGYSFFGRRSRPTGIGGVNGKDEKTVQLSFRAANYDVFRIVSLRVRQSLVRHGLCGPLHAGLPPYDPRNGIALATVPLHLRHAFRRLNDVVFYSLQIGHVAYVRQQREVRGMEGYLCITHDSILLLQLDGKCPRWLDLEDIVGVQYVLRSNHSFISIRAAEPYPDFVFIPIIPSYPPNSSFDVEECVEGIVSMVRRLLMQRLRAGEEVALAPVSGRRASVQTAEDVEEYDVLCHIHDLSKTYTDVFKYIAEEQSAGTAPLRWRWDNSKTPTHFTFKRDLFHALEREEGEDSEDEDDAALGRSQRRPFVSSAATHAHMVESLVPVRQPQLRGPSAGILSLAVPSACSPQTASAGGRGVHPSSSVRSAGGGSSTASSHSLPASRASPRQDSLYSNASFMPATMTQLMAPPSRGAELRAKRRLLVTRTDRRSVSATEAAETLPRGFPGAGAPASRPARAAASPVAAATVPTQASAVKAPATSLFGPPQRSGTAVTTAALGSLPPRPAPVSHGATVAPGTKAVPTTRPAAAAPATPPPHAASSAGTDKEGQAQALTRPPSTKPNTYGLVPSQHHTDPSTLEFGLPCTAKPVSPVATAQKGVHLSDIQQQRQSGALLTQAMHQHLQCTSAVSPSATARGAATPAPSSTDTATKNATARATGSGGSTSLRSSAASTPKPSGASTVSAATPAAVTAAAAPKGGPLHAATQRTRSTSAGRHDSATNGSRSPHNVTHTTENMSNRGDDEDEESDEDFDSEDMEDMLKRPESHGVTPPPQPQPHLQQPPAAAPSSSAAAAAAGLTQASAVVGAGGGPAFIPVGDGVVTQVVLTAEMLPGYGRNRNTDLHSEVASAPSPSLQARPDMAAFIPPAALP